MSRISLQFRVPPQDVEKLLVGELSILLKKFAAATYKKLPSITSQFKTLTREVFRAGKMNQGLVHDTLAGEFGLPKSTIFDTAEKIIDIIADNLFVDFNSKLEGSQISGRLTVQLSSNVYQELMDANFAEIKTKKGVILPWINWSLFQGDKVIIDDYRVIFRVGAGRSGLAIMKADSSSFWKVPSEVSGTEKDNWITREIKKQRDAYLVLTQNSFSEILNSVL